MDSYEVPDITFLDLSGEDENTCKEIYKSLCDKNSSVELPWKVVLRLKRVNKTDYPINHLPSTCQSIDLVHQVQQPPIQVNHIRYNGYLNQQPETLKHPANYPVRPVTNSYPVQSQFIVYPHNLSHSVNATPASPVCGTPQVLPPVVNVNRESTQFGTINSVQEFTSSAPVSLSNITPKLSCNSNIISDVKSEPVFNPDKNSYDKTSIEDKQKDDYVKENGDLAKLKNFVNEKSVSIPKSKTWSSLFGGNTANDVFKTNGTNDTIKSNMAVIHETNNNNEDNCVNPRKEQFVNPNLYRMGEYLLRHKVEGRTISLLPRGLINRSNYCYVNSILQALLHCPPLYNLMLELSKQYTLSENKKLTPVIDAMCRFIKEFKHLSAGQRVIRRNEKNIKKDQTISIEYDPPFEASWMYKMLNGTRTDSFLIEGRQEDAEEFLGCLLNGLNDEMLELMKVVKSNLNINIVDKTEKENDNEWQVMGPKNKGSITRQVDYVKTPICNIFGGSLKSRIHRTGDHSTSNIQPFFTLQLNIKKVKTVNEALEALVTKNQLEGVTSVNTNEQVEAWQQVTLEELPVILILHLKCFDFKLNGCTKIVKALEFPIDLKIDSKLLSSQPTTPKEKQYKLFAVVYHDGREATKGHYLTDAFHVGYSSWVRYDDAAVKAVQEEQVLKPQGSRVPYLLFYRRSDKIRSK